MLRFGAPRDSLLARSDPSGSSEAVLYGSRLCRGLQKPHSHEQNLDVPAKVYVSLLPGRGSVAIERQSLWWRQGTSHRTTSRFCSRKRNSCKPHALRID